MSDSKKHTARLFKALCDENRLLLLEQISQGEICACVLQQNMNLAQSTISHHMKILCDSGLVDSRKEGKWMFYSISPTGCKEAIDYISELWYRKKTAEPIRAESCS